MLCLAVKCFCRIRQLDYNELIGRWYEWQVGSIKFGFWKTIFERN
jgi:hypothetical protein